MHHGDVASIERRVRGDGTVAFRVVWRDPTQPGRQSLTFDDRRQAEQTIKLLDANGQRLTLAVEVANAIRQGGPTVEDAVREHIELLNRVGEDAHDRRQGPLIAAAARAGAASLADAIADHAHPRGRRNPRTATARPGDRQEVAQ